MEERLLSKNNFEVPTVEKDDNAAVRNIIRLILCDPGTFPLHPEMGVGLYSKFRYGWTDEVTLTLRSEILKQMTVYMPELLGVGVNIESVRNELYITIRFNSTIVTFVTNTENKSLSIAEAKGE